MNNAMKFLLYSYFGVTVEDKGDIVLERVVKKAYADATQQGAYNTKLMDESTKEKSNEAYKEAYCKIVAYIKGFCGQKSQKGLEKDETVPMEYQEWHKVLSKKLMKVYEMQLGEDFFSYGNAQKWINMTTKYLWMLQSIYSQTKGADRDFCEKYGEKFRSIEDELHIPVDSYILEAVWHEEFEEDDKGNLTDKEKFDIEQFKIELPYEKGEKIKRRNKFSSTYLKPWSKWKENEYDVFQKTLSEEMLGEKNPLEWECDAWLKIAKRRRKI